LEVLLYVSTDIGTTWTLHARQPAAKSQFLFQAPRDAEYWFASRTIAQGVSAPNSVSIKPELKVMVDTVEPKLDVQATIGAQGEISVAWEAFDDQLASNTVKVEYQSGLGGTWHPVTIDRPKKVVDGKTVRGETSWWADDKDRIVSIRVEVRDQADNVSHMIRRLIIPLTFTPRPNQEKPLPASSIPADPLARYGLPADEPAKPRSVPRKQAKRKPAKFPKPEPVSWPSDDIWTDTTQSKSNYPPSRSPVGPRVANRAGSRASAPADRSPFRPDTSGTSPFDTEMTSNSPFDPETSSNSPNRPSDTGGLPPGERPRMTRTKRFNLDYSIDAVGPLGVEKVELWATRNGGRDWDLWGVDEDHESPFLVEMENEGVYGFRIVIVGKNGLASETPRSGDLADLWVGVDTTKPVAEITTATYGTDAYAGHLDIQWDVNDDHLGARPITLQFSEKRNCDWTTIASGLPNTGQYYWRVDSRVPPSFFLRLEVRDEAGNVNSYQLKSPIKSAGLTPRGQVQGFRPL